MYVPTRITLENFERIKDKWHLPKKCDRKLDRALWRKHRALCGNIGLFGRNVLLF